MAAVKKVAGGTAPLGPLLHETPWGDVLEWRLPVLMVHAGFRFATALHEALVKEGIDLAYSNVHRLTQRAPERLSIDVQFALCRVLGCSVADLWMAKGQIAKPKTMTVSRSKLKEIKPVRARGLK